LWRSTAIDSDFETVADAFLMRYEKPEAAEGLQRQAFGFGLLQGQLWYHSSIRAYSSCDYVNASVSGSGLAFSCTPAAVRRPSA